MKTIGVDFDGVIHWYRDGWQDGSIYDDPVPGAFDALKMLMEKYAVFIFTSRSKLQVADWLREHGFRVTTDFPCDHDDWDGTFWDQQGTLLVTNQKLGAMCYIDDRAIRFLNWEQALHDLEEVMEGD